MAEKFNEAPCRKCGSRTIEVNYDRDHDLLFCECARCGYGWDAAPLWPNHEPMPAKEGDRG